MSRSLLVVVGFAFSWLILCSIAAASAATRTSPLACRRDGIVDWYAATVALWRVVDDRSANDQDAWGKLALLDGHETDCPLGLANLDIAINAAFAQKGELGQTEQLPDPFDLGSLEHLVAAGLPIFGALAWALDAARGHAGVGDSHEDLSEDNPGDACTDEASQLYLALLRHHLPEKGGSVPSTRSLEYLALAGRDGRCPLGRASALLALALAAAEGDEEIEEEVLGLLAAVEALLMQQELLKAGRWRRLHRPWPVLSLLHALSRRLAGLVAPSSPLQGCLLIIFAFPTDEIRRDTQEFLQILERYYYIPLGVRHPLVVFTDPGTAPTVEAQLQAFVSAPVMPAVIPKEDLSRFMPSYSCIDGFDCTSGAKVDTAAHRGVVNKTQYWSPEYLRISRYTAGPLFLHPALDSCGAFMKLDTDFFLTAPLQSDPLEELRREGAQLAYWQIHVQGQRQAGYTEAAISFLKSRGTKIRNLAFYARGRFEEKAERLGIPLSEVPEALEAATVIYGCLFGGDVRFFREPLYQDFFRYMDKLQGFEQAGWSNQFFLGTAAAAFLYPSQVRRLYISGRHQESQISVANGNVTEYLTGSSKSVFR